MPPWLDGHGIGYDQPAVPSELREIIDGFSRDGCVTIDSGIPPETLDAVLGLQVAQHESSSQVTVQDAWRWSPAVREIASAPRVLRLLRVLYQRRPIPFRTVNVQRASEQSVHCDAIHFHSFPERFLCSVWIALEDITADSGKMFYYRGSHRLPTISLADIGITASEQIHQYATYARYEAVARELIASSGLERVDVQLQRGQALIWSATLFHGSQAAAKERQTRRAQLTNYFFEDCAYWIPLASDLPLGRVKRPTVIDIASGAVVPHKWRGHLLEPNDGGAGPAPVPGKPVCG